MAFTISRTAMNATRKENAIAFPAFAAAGIVRKKIAAVGVTTAIEVTTACRTSRVRSLRPPVEGAGVEVLIVSPSSPVGASVWPDGAVGSGAGEDGGEGGGDL